MNKTVCLLIVVVALVFVGYFIIDLKNNQKELTQKQTITATIDVVDGRATIKWLNYSKVVWTFNESSFTCQEGYRKGYYFDGFSINTSNATGIENAWKMFDFNIFNKCLPPENENLTRAEYEFYQKIIER